MRLAFIFSLLLAACCSGDESFPENPGLDGVSMQLERTICLGECPGYEVEVRGDGKVTYRGTDFVLVEGEHTWVIPPSDVEALIDLFRKADFFQLKDRYEVEVTDLPTYVVRLSIGGRHKEVTDYLGEYCETEFGPSPPCMPNIVAEIEDQLDKISGAISLVEGDDRTIGLLERINFDFQSQEAARAVSRALEELDTKLARALIERGAPIEAVDLPASSGLFDEVVPPIIIVPLTGDVELARLMVERGALVTEEMRRGFLVSSAASGNPEMIRLALQHVPDLGNLPVPLLLASAGVDATPDGTYEEEEFKKEKYKLALESFDGPAAMRMLLEAGADPKATDEEGNTALHVVKDAVRAKMLIDAGADPNAANKEGRTPLHETWKASVAEVLIAAGAVVDARDEDGDTPLFEQWDADKVRVLLTAGADPDARNRFGHTALFFANTDRAASALIEGGVDVKVVDRDGNSALNTAKSIGAAVLILRAGGPIPTDPEKLAKFARWAEMNESEELLSALRRGKSR